MKYPVGPNLLVPRTCTTRAEQNGERESRPLVDFRETPAYVLLGDPGAGKTKSFEQEAAATGGHYVRARSFAALDPSPELSNKALFIDGLDEMRAGGSDGRTPLDHIRRHLDRLGRPRFRLSCREADWYGDSDSAALMETAPGGALTVLHLDPLSEADIRLLLERKFAIDDPADFIRQADRHGLADLLRNPQTLGMLANAVGSDARPDSRAATYDLACRQLLREANAEHRAAKRDTAPTHDALLEAAGFLCAVHLLAGIAGFALDDDAADAQHPLWRELTLPRELPLSAALASGLFQHDEREQQRIPVHRSIAEFLGARYLAELIDKEGLPLGRVVALLAGEDGGIVPDLRGLTAWLAVHCRSARAELVNRDPLGVVLYGDVRGFPADDKRRVFSALRDEARRYAHFRFEDWTAAPFGALATPDTVPVFLEMLAAPSRTEADIALLDCALDALLYGPLLAELATSDELTRLNTLLDDITRDSSYPSHIRYTALKVLLRDLPRNAPRLVSLAEEVNAGAVPDEDDQLLGQLLTKLYPEHIETEEIFDFLHPEKQSHLIGAYLMFWNHHLPHDASDDQLPRLLDKLVTHSSKSCEMPDQQRHERLVGDLLVRTLETHGDNIDDTRLYEWLGTGLDEYGYPRISNECQKRIYDWLTMRPNRYKTILLVSITKCIGKEDIWSCLSNGLSHLYDAKPPADIIPWYLEQAATETHSELKQCLFSRAVGHMIREAKDEHLTLADLDYLGSWIAKHPGFEYDLKPFIACDIDDWRRHNSARRRNVEAKRTQQMLDWRTHFYEHLDAICEGSAHPGILNELAQVYLMNHMDIKGETSCERLANFLSGDNVLISAAYSGFRQTLERDDLPSVTEIVDLATKDRMHYIRQPCLVGMEELYCSDPETALHLGDAVLRKLLAFRLTWFANEEAVWFMALVEARPELVAEVLVAYALPMLRKGREHVNGIWQLAYEDDYSALAPMALPDLLKGFPLRVKNSQLNSALDPLLKAALRYLDRQDLLTLIAERLGKGSMSAAQRVYWLACALLVSPEEYERPLADHIGSSKALRGHLGAFFHERRPGFDTTALPESSLALLVELLAPDSPPERQIQGGLVSQAMQTSEVVRSFIDTLGGIPSEAARQQLERLLTLPTLAPWQDRLQHAAHTQRIARRKAVFRHLGAAEVCRTLANREPTNAADLAALTEAHLRDLARKIRDGSTNDYRQYWSYDAGGKPEHPKPENDCRDILLSDLKERLGRLNVDAIKECYYAEDKRADIRVSYGGATSFNVPIEIKKDCHSDLWRAIHEQLIERYTRDPGADGYGIYLVFWFGGERMPLPPEGKPRSAAELELQLHSKLTRDEARYIAISVIDCSLP